MYCLLAAYSTVYQAKLPSVALIFTAELMATLEASNLISDGKEKDLLHIKKLTVLF